VQFRRNVIVISVALQVAQKAASRLDSLKNSGNK
jgi:hypothetical protein